MMEKRKENLMELVTTRHAGAVPKPFSWSYTKLKNFETCPKRHYHYDVARDVVEPESDALRWGNIVHKILEQRIRDGTELPPVHAPLEKWAKFVLTGPGTVYVEQKWAITQDFAPCDWKDRSGWYRTKGDVVKINGPVGVVIDWKTGKILEDAAQLFLMSACCFYHFPDLQKIRAMFVWLKDDADTRIDITRDQLPKLWNDLWSRIETLKQAAERMEYPPTPNYLCREWCAVTSCPFHGKSHR